MSAFNGGNPFSIAGNPFAGGSGGFIGGGLGLLKKKTIQKPFTELDVSVAREINWKKNATARMREIDSVRLHVPEATERTTFRIPESTDRVNLEDQKHLMVLCGGFAGVRFSTEDLTFIRASTHLLSEQFETLDVCFKWLPNAFKRICLTEECISNIPNVDVCVFNEEKIVEGLTDEQQEVVRFHIRADAVLVVLRRIQELVQKKHSEFLLAAQGTGLEEPLMSQDGDGEENMSAKPRPVWLETLLRKYLAEVAGGSGRQAGDGKKDAPPPPQSSLPPVGSLCAFLSCCAVKQVAMTKAEAAALFEASCDFAACSAGNSPETIDDEIFSHTQKYWARRFFVFMKKLTELKTATKDEKSLFLFDRFIL